MNKTKLTKSDIITNLQSRRKQQFLDITDSEIEELANEMVDDINELDDIIIHKNKDNALFYWVCEEDNDKYEEHNDLTWKESCEKYGDKNMIALTGGQVVCWWQKA